MPDGIPTPDEWAAITRDAAVAAVGAGEATIAAELLQAIIDAARAGLPNESCGLLVAHSFAAEDAAPTRYVPLRNAAESPYRYM